MNCDNQCCENKHDHYINDRYGINVTAMAHTQEPLVVEQAAELVPVEMRKPGTKISFWTFDGWQTWQFQQMDVREWVLPESWVQDTEELKDIQNQIDSIQIGGWAISNQLGDDPHIGISQQALTEIIGYDHIPNSIRGRIQAVEDEIGTDTTSDSLSGRITSLENAVGTGGSVDTRINQAKNQIIGNADSDYNTLGKLEERIHEESSERSSDVSILNTKIDTSVSTLTTKINTDVTTERNRAMSAEELLRQAYEALTQTEVVVGALPGSGATGKIYRVPGESSYADYMWNGSQFVKMAEYDNAIDDAPVNGSDNLISSGAVAKYIANEIPFTSEPGGVDYHDGTDIVSATTYFRTEYIDITGINKIIYANLCLVGSNNHGMSFYDANKVFIDGVKHVSYHATVGYEIKKISVPVNAVYARFTYYQNEKLGRFFVADYDKDCIYRRIDSAATTEELYHVWSNESIGQYYINGKHIEENEGTYSWVDSGACFMIPVSEGEQFAARSHNSGVEHPFYYLSTNSTSVVDIVGDPFYVTNVNSFTTYTVPAGVNYLCITRIFTTTGYRKFYIRFYKDIATINNVNTLNNWVYQDNVNFENATCSAVTGVLDYGSGSLQRLTSNMFLVSGRIKVSVADGYYIRSVIYYDLNSTFIKGSSYSSNHITSFITEQRDSAYYVRIVVNKADDTQDIYPNDNIGFKIANFTGEDVDLLKQYTFNSSCNTENTTAIGRKYCNLIRGKDGNIETFLFFSDPHLGDRGRYEPITEGVRDKYISMLQKYYNSLPLDLCICGGDIITSEDTYEDACRVLGYTDAYMRKLFPNYYLTQGNHDTNPYNYTQDPGGHKLQQQEVNNLMFRESGKEYYSFDGRNTKFYAMNTGLSSDEAVTSMDEHQWEQIDWFANSLLSDDPAHAMILVHIPGCIMTENIMAVAVAFNNKQVVTLNGITYDFTSSSGRVEYCLAGHNHADGVSGQYEIPLIIETNLQGGVYSDTINRTGHHYALVPSFDNCLCDYTNHRLYMVRTGAGYHRTINNTVNMVAVGNSTYLTPSISYTELVWQSGNTDVATINSDGLITASTTGVTRIKAINENMEEEYWVLKVV